MRREDSRVEAGAARKSDEIEIHPAVGLYLFPSDERRKELRMCFGFEDEGSTHICWEETLRDLFATEGVCFEKDGLGGLERQLGERGFLFYDRDLQRIETGAAEKLELVFIGSPTGEQWFVFRQAMAQQKKLYFIADITEQVGCFRQMLWQKERDRLTGLFNRESFLSRCAGVLAAGRHALMVFIDMDDLKKMNDNWGHKTGDRYIMAMAEHVSAFFAGFEEPRKVIGRLAGDEFAVCIGGFDTAVARDECLQGLNQRVDLPLPDGSHARLAFSSGAARYPEDSTLIDDLLIFADFAMSIVKKSEKGGVSFFSRSEHDALLDISRSQEKLKELLEKKAISFIYFPYIDSVSGAFRVLEMFPVGDIPGLEDIEQLKIVSKHSYLTPELDRVIYAAMKEEFEKLAQIDFPQPVTLGYMPQDLFYQGELEKFIQATGFPSTRLTLCFDAQMRSNYERMKSISQARGLGIRFGFKEFGPTSSDAALEFRPDIVKLSKALVLSCADDADEREMVKNLIELAHKFQFASAAGYIPSTEVQSFFRSLGVNLLGGEAVHRPITLAGIEDFLRQQEKPEKP